MCGIAGYVGPSEIAEERLVACLELMRRRGPDAAGRRRWRTQDGRNAYLLNTRLAILDLDERANQPFDRAGLHLTYNGEVYNYLELRKRFADRGAIFRTASDTEVVLTAIAEDGWAVVDAFEGMWALAVYDESDGSLTLSRDRFGEKPLYLLRENGGIYFGSEPKLIATLRGRPLSVDRQQLRRYLVNGYKALYKSGATFFEGLTELPPASLLRVGPGGVEESSVYWRPRFDPSEEMSYEEAVGGVRERLARAVDLRLRADVPLAFCMSGGVDSTALISVAKRLCGYDVHGFTIENTDARYDERESVERSVAELGIRHTSIPLKTERFLDHLRELVRYHDAPVYTISYFVQWRLMEEIARAGYKVSVSGTAADELLSGYYDHHLAYLYEVRRDEALHAEALAAWARDVRPLVRNPYLGDPTLFVRDPDFRDHIYLDADALSACLTAPWAEPFTEEHYASDLLRNRMLNELLHESVPVILHEDDLNAMYFSVENRSPYLDRAMTEFAYRIPTRHLVRDGAAKAVLRDAVRGIAPDHVLDSRRKVGFNAPIESLLDGSDPSVRKALLGDSPVYELVRREAVEQLLDACELPNSRSKFLFNVLSAKFFLEEFAA
ncbi:MAG TPA: asparagine synthase (glutamine-hydrolyzing) [Gaiellaceae bacterium]|nr:asparagine synthase (glutamine-hydrolyzing) [Gaiellaceae bacterium]